MATLGPFFSLVLCLKHWREQKWNFPRKPALKEVGLRVLTRTRAFPPAAIKADTSNPNYSGSQMDLRKDGRRLRALASCVQSASQRLGWEQNTAPLSTSAHFRQEEVCFRTGCGWSWPKAEWVSEVT